MNEELVPEGVRNLFDPEYEFDGVGYWETGPNTDFIEPEPYIGVGRAETGPTVGFDGIDEYEPDTETGEYLERAISRASNVFDQGRVAVESSIDKNHTNRQRIRNVVRREKD